MGPVSAKSYLGQAPVRVGPPAGRAKQEKYAAYLNLIEPWWKVLRSLALAGRRFETWDEVTEAVTRATDYWNAYRHPFLWGHRRRHRQPGIALLPVGSPASCRITCWMNH
jgi:hypothetical protein